MMLSSTAVTARACSPLVVVMSGAFRSALFPRAMPAPNAGARSPLSVAASTSCGWPTCGWRRGHHTDNSSVFACPCGDRRLKA